MPPPSRTKNPAARFAPMQAGVPVRMPVAVQMVARVLVLVLVLVLMVVAGGMGCVEPARPTPPKDLPLEAMMWLDQKFRPGMVVRTTRVLTATEIDDAGKTTEAWQEAVYRTVIEQTDPHGRPIAGIRVYDRALFRLTGPAGVSEGTSAVQGQHVVFRPGRPPLVEGEEVPDSLALGLSMQSFETVFLPTYPVWEGAAWSPDPSQIEPLNRFLRQLGLVPDRNDIRVTWQRTRTLSPASPPSSSSASGPTAPHRAAVLTVRWQSSGLMATPTRRQQPAQVTLEGSLLFDIDAGVVTAMSLRGVNPTLRATFNISITREVLSPDQSPIPAPPNR